MDDRKFKRILNDESGWQEIFEINSVFVKLLENTVQY